MIHITRISLLQLAQANGINLSRGCRVHPFNGKMHLGTYSVQNKQASAENDSPFGDILPQQIRCFPSIPIPIATFSTSIINNLNEVTLSGSLQQRDTHGRAQICLVDR